LILPSDFTFTALCRYSAIRQTILIKRILTAVVLVPIVVALVLFAPMLAIAAVTCAVALLALHEYLALAKANGVIVFSRVPMVATVAIFAAALPSIPTLWMLAVLVAAVSIILTHAAAARPLPRILLDTAASSFGLVYVAVPLATLPLIAQQENGRAQLLFLLLVVWAGDIAALFIGRAIGGKKLWPRISPNKTWAGAVGSVLGSVGVAVLTVAAGAHASEHFARANPFPEPLWYWIVLAIVLNIAAQFGDLLESAIKRGAGVKDSGTLLPGHGGVLDRIDALLLAAPALWFAQLLQQYFW
jgi:phosphatidate cytidylyltransferase